MKKTILHTAILLTATMLVGQGNNFDTSFYSPALDKEKMVGVQPPLWHYKTRLSNHINQLPEFIRAKKGLI
jgi:hypothetical protein